MEIGERLREQRKTRQLSQAKLAEALHLSRQSISKWENGTALPSFANVVAISELFGISLDELIKGDEALMDHLKHEEFIRPISKLVIMGIAICVGILIVFAWLHISMIQVSGWLGLIAVVGFIGLLCTLNWEQLNKSLSRKAVIWGAICLGTLAAPAASNMIATAIKAMIEGFNRGYHG
ncbi:DNA-binding protein [Lactobacillus hokkaidonensis JCM] [Lactiplantibacillus mudanjiangensis]|uniref:helix-turn-helix domain-containing protein n=1 Tax=Lactiplantibacillus mudanjiangensis TaxID=1296538 RepID=UPI001013F8F0|nr:helix-turn-helix transcriptional regulator [Lactiplantibacillus mudanjiangensis]VDG33489.1 DNA-binding protein [Lactobacillus hokkaidonensis JCM] [Lactiplantibacillus mudanjiangensis]